MARGAGPVDAHAAQLRHQIDQTRAALNAMLTQLEPHALGPVRGGKETAARATRLLSRYPWLNIAAGALLGYQLHRAKTRPARPVPHPPPRAPAGARQADHLRRSAAAARTSDGPAGAGSIP
jgi:hypothetical protein